MKKVIAFLLWVMMMFSSYADGRVLLKDATKHNDKDYNYQTGRKLLKDATKHNDKDYNYQTGR